MSMNLSSMIGPECGEESYTGLCGFVLIHLHKVCCPFIPPALTPNGKEETGRVVGPQPLSPSLLNECHLATKARRLITRWSRQPIMSYSQRVWRTTNLLPIAQYTSRG